MLSNIVEKLKVRISQSLLQRLVIVKNFNCEKIVHTFKLNEFSFYLRKKDDGILISIADDKGSSVAMKLSSLEMRRLCLNFVDIYMQPYSLKGSSKDAPLHSGQRKPI